MTTELGELYQELILDHNKNPRNFGSLSGASHKAEGFNPLCGDRLTVYLEINKGILEKVSFVGDGCAISKASASLMTESLRGKDLAEADKYFQSFHAMVTGTEVEGQGVADLGKLSAFSGVQEFPVRVKCASLAWHTLNAAIKNEQNVVSTE